MSTAPAFASVGEAIEMARAALGYLAAVDAAQLPAETQAECLCGLERFDAVCTAVRASFLSAFTVGQGYSADADYSARAWLMHKTGITRGAAASHTAWATRAGTHPAVLAALAAGELSESYGRSICRWTDRLPEKYRAESDELLLAAAAAGLGLPDLGALFAEMYERARSELPDEDPDRDFADRGVRLETTFQGAGVLYGDLTPECAALVSAVLDALAAPGGAEDDRTREQRYHDGLQEAMRRLAASESGSDGGAWLDGDAAEAIACDAAMAPIVTGDVNVAALEDLVRLCAELGRLRHDGDDADADTDAGAGAPSLGTGPARAALEQAIIGRAVDLLSGPGGLASFLRRRQLGARLGGPSLPLDIGYAETIPAGIRNAVLLRDRHCQWAGRCDQPAAACQVHHVKHKANGGPTSVKGCVLLCFFHHQIVIHQWGWTLVLNSDGTTTAWNKDRTKVLHSHSPPVRPG